MPDCTLTDGRRVLLRPATLADAQELERLFYRLTPESVHMWLCAGVRQTPYYAQTIVRYAECDGLTSMTLVAEHAGGLVGVARSVRVTPPTEAEIALVIEDAWQRRHLGRAMLRALAASSFARAISHFIGDCLVQNTRVIRMIDSVFSQRQTTYEGGVYHLRLPLTAVSAVSPGWRRKDGWA